MAVITTANAREMAARSAQARRERRDAIANAPLIAAASEPSSDYAALRVACVRAQLARIDAMMLQEHDAQKLDRLAAASAKLAEQERVLDGRPLPGSRRPGKERAASTPPIVPL